MRLFPFKKDRRWRRRDRTISLNGAQSYHYLFLWEREMITYYKLLRLLLQFMWASVADPAAEMMNIMIMFLPVTSCCNTHLSFFSVKFIVVIFYCFYALQSVIHPFSTPLSLPAVVCQSFILCTALIWWFLSIELLMMTIEFVCAL